MGLSARDSSDDSQDARPTPPRRRADEPKPDWLVGAEEGLSAEVLSARPSIPRLTFVPGTTRPTLPQAPAPPPPAAESDNDKPAPPSTEQIPRLGEPRAPAPTMSVPKIGGLSEVSGDTRSRAMRSFSGGDVDASLYTWKPTEETETPAAPAEAVEAQEPARRLDPSDDASARKVLRAWAEERPPEPGSLEIDHEWEDRFTAQGRTGARKKKEKKAASGAPNVSFAWLANPRVWIGAACVAALATVGAFAWPKENPGLSISYIRHHASELDGRQVSVKGRVGEVFPVGGSYVYYLHQGRDTLVVFSRSRVPSTKDRISVVGTISTGFLDGAPRAALFELAP